MSAICTDCGHQLLNATSAVCDNCGHADDPMPIGRSTGRTRDNGEFAAFARRILRAYSRRIGEGHIEDLCSLHQLGEEIRRLEDQAVAQLRTGEYPRSWGEIGRELGITRQAAQQRFRSVGGDRRPGGQPSQLR